MGTLSYVTVLVAAGVNRQLREGVPVRGALFLDLVEPPARLVFEDAGGPRPVDAWAAGLASRGAVRARLVDKAPEPVARVGGDEIEPRLLAGFAGPSALLLAIETPWAIELYQPSEAYPRRTLLEASDVFDFVESFARREDLKEGLLWEAEHNLGFPAGTTWRAFVAGFPPADPERLVEAVSRRFSNVKLIDAAAPWYALTRRARNPVFAPVFRFAAAGSVDRLPAPPPLDAQRQRLAAALDAIRRFASENKLDDWARHFERAQGFLSKSSLDAEPFGRALILQCHLPEPRARLAMAALHADVFGGMGSWNDLGLADRAAYDAVSEALYRELRPSLEAAVGA